MRQYLILQIGFLFIYCLEIKAQVKTNFNNSEIVSDKGIYNKEYKNIINYELAEKNIKEILESEINSNELKNETKLFKLAIPVEVDIDLVKEIQWISSDEYYYGKYTINLKGALSSSINFDRFYLPLGSEMFIYNENAEMITGPITNNENNSNNIWGSWVYRGNYLNIEIKVPSKLKTQLILHSNNIAYGYKEVYKNFKVGAFGQSGSCNINVVCPIGSTWEPERNSVGLILSANGQYWCSGSLVMNTCNTNRPFFLTANHCFTGQNVSAWRFTFQAWSPTCTPSQNSDGITFNGSTLRANWSNSDFCLVELNNTPASNSGIHYSGWSRSTTPPQNATGIHHPSGDVMKISISSNPLLITSFAGYPANHHWLVSWTQGVTEGGSSGSPIYDQNHRVVGVLTGGPSICGGSALRDYYGRFDLSWSGGGAPSSRLRDWLDPTNSGANTTITTNINSLNAAPINGRYLNIAGNSVVCGTSQTYTINGVSPGASINWQILRPTVGNGYQLPPFNVCSLNSNGNQATLTKINNGNIRLSAILSYCGGITEYAIKDVTFGIPPIANNGAYAPNNGWYNTFNGNSFQFTTGTTTAISMANPSNNTYTFSKSGGSSLNSSITNWGNGNAGVVFTPPVNNQSQINLSVLTSNTCGTNTSSVVLIYNGTPVNFRIFPNPAKEYINIYEVDDKNNIIIGKSKIQNISIINKFGVTVLNLSAPKYTPNIITIPIGHLNNDIYTVRIFNGKETKSQILLIQH